MKERVSLKSCTDRAIEHQVHSFLDESNSKDIPLKKMVDSNYKTNVRKARETTTLIASYTLKLRGHKYSVVEQLGIVGKIE